jgi:6-pyruvoyltetrahydropterin/6-carboxytetrahydropterin synthase
VSTTLHVRHEAQAGFDAARHPPGEGLQGHSFTVQVRGRARSLRALQAALDAWAAPLDGGQLEQRLDRTDDAGLAAAVAAALQDHAVEQVVLHAGARRGVLWDAGRVVHWRRHAFEAAHQLPHVPPGHKCGRMHGHGFGVLLHAREACAAIDEAWAPLHFMLHRRCLNRLDGLRNPTSEVLAAWIWQRLADALPGLLRVTVFETGSSGAAFDGLRFGIWKQFTLDSAVAEGDELLGHTFALRLHLAGALDERLGWVVDFGDVKAGFAPLFEQLDHQPLHERLRADAAGCDALARWIFAAAEASLPALDRLDLHETPGCGVVVARDVAALHAGP